MSALLPFILVLGACSYDPDGKPDELSVARIESTLARMPCIGNLDDWERRYYFKRQRNNLSPIEMVKRWEFAEWIVDPNVIDIDLREAHFADFGSGKHVFSNAEDPPGFGGVDDRNYNVAFGTHDLTTGSTELWACGPNMSAP